MTQSVPAVDELAMLLSCLPCWFGFLLPVRSLKQDGKRIVCDLLSAAVYDTRGCTLSLQCYPFVCKRKYIVSGCEERERCLAHLTRI
jgi:hypothetical protein